MKRLAVCILSATLLLSSLFIISNNVNALGGRPARPDSNNPRSQSIFIHTLEPGESSSDAATVSNTTAQPQIIDIYAVDAIATNTGSLSCEQRVEEKDGVGAWVNLDSEEVSLEPNSSQEVEFTITAPQSAEPGEHNGCLVFQQREEDSEVLGNVKIRTRQAIRIAVTIPGDLKKELSIDSFSVETEKNKQLFVLKTKNQGNVSVDIKAKVTLESLFGSVVFEDNGSYPVLPNNDLELRFENDQLPIWGGWYKAKAAVEYDPRPEVFGSTDESELTSLDSQAIVVFIPPAWQIITGFMALVVLIIVIIVIYHHRRKKTGKRSKKRKSKR